MSDYLDVVLIGITNMNRVLWMLCLLLPASSAPLALASDGSANPDKQLSFASLQSEWDQAEQACLLLRHRGKSGQGKDGSEVRAPDPTAFAERFLQVADAHQGTKEELLSLAWASLNAPESGAGKTATARLADHVIDRSDLEHLREAIESAGARRPSDRKPLVAATLTRVQRSLEHPDAARLLAWVCSAYIGDESATVPEPFRGAADLIADRFADSPDISHFCESLYVQGRRCWAAEFEQHVRSIAELNRTPLIRATSRYALATVLRHGTAEGDAKALELFRRFVADYDGKAEGGVEELLLSMAKSEVVRIERCGIGRPAQEITGEDLAGNPIRLSEYKGKVVLLVFWASWCGPCMEELPHEKELVQRFAGRPFVLVGVNGDLKRQDAREAVEREEIPFRSIWNGGLRGPITKSWVVDTWPSVFVIDHRGIIRRTDLHGTSLDEPLEVLVAEAETATKRAD